MEVPGNFIKQVRLSIQDNTLIKVTLSKHRAKESDLKNVYARLVHLKNTSTLSFTYHFQTNDQTKNLEIEEGVNELNKLICEVFKNATLTTKNAQFQLMTSKKGKQSLIRTKNESTVPDSHSHDRKKKKRLTGNERYLNLLRVSDEQGNIIPKMADKFRQINKYLEVVESLIKSTKLPRKISIVDMGSGKGYLTFALYDFLKHKIGLDVHVVGVELRSDLVDLCNDIAQKCRFGNLKFCVNSIQSFEQETIDILIALHACDTATDDALSTGIAANAKLIISAPCCHKQIRQQVKGKEQKSPLLMYGIFKERQFEMVTDTLRALILEKHQYQTKIFEFVSNEHTRKNILLVGSKSSKTVNTQHIDKKITDIKSEYGIKSHYLEELI